VLEVAGGDAGGPANVGEVERTYEVVALPIASIATQLLKPLPYPRSKRSTANALDHATPPNGLRVLPPSFRLRHGVHARLRHGVRSVTYPFASLCDPRLIRPFCVL